jgi:hypothetical protein
MAKTEAELAAAAEELTDAALALRESVETEKRRRRTDRVVMAALAAILALTLWQSRQNGETLQIVEDATSAEARAESERRLAGAMDEIDRRFRAAISEAVSDLDCLMEQNLDKHGPCP